VAPVLRAGARGGRARLGGRRPDRAGALNLSPDADLTLDVGGPAYGGGCVATAPDGRTVFVRHALPGETVVARITEEQDRYLRADAVSVVVASPDRVEPPCPYAAPGRCGGCDWQHASLAAQRSLKASVIREQFSRVAGIDVDVVVEAVDDDGLGWRSRVRFAVTEDGRLGLHRHRSESIEPVDACLIASPGVESVGAEALRWPGMAEVEVIAGEDRAVVVTARRKKAPVGADVAPDVSVLRGDGRGGAAPVRGRPGVRETAAGRTWWVGGSGFWQAHVAAPDVLVTAVLSSLEPVATDVALDLYSGVGLFAGALAPLVARVFAAESDPGAVADARQNLRDLPNAEAHEGRVDLVLARLGLGRADLVVLDPPRDGAGAPVMAAIAALEPRRIAYVSCDPGSLARDLRDLPGYALTSLRAFDLFPMTAHVECVALLEPA
jgi:tRNA/tmRNA/rRNA uracil-C5-methylase (TrmA/RlmC/RlmD family)